MAKYDELKYSKKDGFKQNDKIDEIFAFSQGYKDYITYAKTERKSVAEAIRLASRFGFCDIRDKTELKPGDKVYYAYRERALILCVIGKEELTKGVLMVASHIDAPRIDLKPTPLYEENDMAFLKTHYYGGIKKYQWTSMPLSLHATIALVSGETVDFTIGEDEADPVFTITDLAPHLAAKQYDKKLRDGITGEALNILAGGIAIEDEDIKDAVKTNVLFLLNEKYGITEEDFISADIEIVPAYPARDVGLDRAFVGGYGQDDRVCAYTSTMAILNSEMPKKTLLCILADKEEIGSTGDTGVQANFIESMAVRLLKLKGSRDTYADLDEMFTNSLCLSADVCVAVDPTYPEVHDKLNAPYMGKGVVVIKYTGSRGKSDTNDADPKLIAKLRNILNNEKITWQIGELGKVDEGGGGTVAKYFSARNIMTIDIGPCVLGLHSPFEIVSKADIYMSYKAYKAFYRLG